MFSFLAEAALFIDDTFTTDKGHFELEYGMQYSKDAQYDHEEDYKSRSREATFYLNIFYGLTDNWDIGITLPYGYVNYDRQIKHNGFMDIELESKYRFFEETELLPALALYAAFISGSANKEKFLGSGRPDAWLNAIISKTLTENLWLDLNLGYYFSGAKGADDALTYGLGLTAGFRERLYLFAELYAEAEFAGKFNENACLAAFSAGYEINPHVFIKAGAAWGISEAADDLMLAGRVCFSF